MAKRYYWLKLKEDFFKNKEIKKLRTIAGGDTFTIIYLKMQLLSLKNEGKLLFESVEDNFAAELALELDEKIENVQVTLEYLKARNLITETLKDEYSLIEAIESIGTEGDSAERMRRLRLKKTSLGDDHVTEQLHIGDTEIEIEIERERELEIKQEIKKESKKKENSQDLNFEQFFYLQNDDFKKAFNDYLEMRAKNKKQATKRAQELVLTKLHEQFLPTAIEMLEQSIVSGWTNVYLPKNEGNYANYKSYNKQTPKPGSPAAAYLINQQMRDRAEINFDEDAENI